MSGRINDVMELSETAAGDVRRTSSGIKQGGNGSKRSSAAPAGGGVKMKRNVGLFSGIGLVVGNMIGPSHKQFPSKHSFQMAIYLD